MAGLTTGGQVKKITAGDGDPGDDFGYSVSISGDIVVVVSTEADAVFIFYRDHGGADNWGKVKKIILSGISGYSGSPLCIDGDTLLVGARGDDDNGSNSGSAYIFCRDQGGTDDWGQVAKIIPNDGVAGDNFGYAVSVHAESVAIGAYQDDDNGTNSGSAYIFEQNYGGDENWGEVQKITDSDGADNDYFGESISISGDTLVSGASRDDDHGTDSGSTYVVMHDVDIDGDGLPDAIENILGTNPNDADTDDDGIMDGGEDKNQDGIIDTAAGETDPCNPDTDFDGIYDGTEIGLTAPQNPQATDQSEGYFVPDADPFTTTDPTDPDTDGDGISDGQEDTNHNGRVDAGETDPSDNSSRPTIIFLNKGFNLIAIPADVTNQPDLKDWLPVLGDSSEIEKVMVYDGQAGKFITLIPDSASNPSFTLIGGEGLIVYAKQDKEITFTSVLCSTHDLKPGFNLVGFACPAEGYSAYQLLNDLGSENVSSVQRYSIEKRAFETAGFGPNGQLAGVDFPIVQGEGYFIYMK